MAWTFGGITLPYGPEKLRWIKTANKETQPVSADDPINIVDGCSNGVQLEGSIAEAGATDADLWTDYLSPLLAQVGYEIAVTSTNGSIDGNWMLDSFEPSRESANLIYNYVMRLSKGSQNLTLG